MFKGERRTKSRAQSLPRLGPDRFTTERRAQSGLTLYILSRVSIYPKVYLIYYSARVSPASPSGQEQ